METYFLLQLGPNEWSYDASANTYEGGIAPTMGEAYRYKSFDSAYSALTIHRKHGVFRDAVIFVITPIAPPMRDRT